MVLMPSLDLKLLKMRWGYCSDMVPTSGISWRMTTKLATLKKYLADLTPPIDDETKIDLSQAENSLIRDELLDIGKLGIANNLSTKTLEYPNGFGSDRALLDALASFFNTYFNPTFPVSPDQISTQAGSGNSLDALMYSICDIGDSVLMPGPVWPSYAPYLLVHPGVNVIVAEAPDFRDSLSIDCVARLEATYDASPEKERIKALVICNPHNPVGACYTPTVLRKLMAFCYKRGLHYVSDEVHALCVQSSTIFTSALSLLDEPAQGETEIIRRSHIHVIWSISKDLGSPGVRLACVVSQANPIMLAATTFASFWQVSVLSSLYVTEILTSPKFPTLVKLNAQRLATSYQILTKALQEWNIEYIPATAGLMLFIKVLKNATKWEEEEDIIRKLSDGWIKILYAVREDVMIEAIKRIGPVLKDLAGT